MSNESGAIVTVFDSITMRFDEGRKKEGVKILTKAVKYEPCEVNT